MLGCAEVLRQAFPEAEIVAFAALRCISNPEEFSTIYAPAVGSIILRDDGSAIRRP